MLMLMKTGQNIKKQYVLIPIPYEETYLKQTNDQLLQEFKERKKIADAKERAEALKATQEKVKARLAGTLFEGDASIIENVTVPKKKKAREKAQKKKPPKDDQQSLF